MRDLLLLAALAGVTPLVLRAPFMGLLVWLWIALMNPQREVYGFLASAPLNLYVAALTAVAWLASRERRTLPFNVVTLCLGLFAVQACVSTAFALDRAHAAPIADRTLKTLVLAFAVVVLADSRARIQAVVWVYAVSLGYYAVKGGAFVLLTRGGQHVYGPENSMISDNNHLGLALVVVIPLINYLRATSRSAAVRWVCVGIMVTALLAVIGTYSRGALVALAAVAAAYGMRSRYGAVLVAVALTLVVAAPSVLPASWTARMATIQSYDQDSSFEGRVAAWRTSTNIAKARPLVGGGFAAAEVDGVVSQFRSAGALEKGRAAHSIFFEVLGDTGFVGLAIFLLALVAAGVNTFLVLSMVRGRPDLLWAATLARMMQVSLVGLVVGGAALSMAYYDGFIVLLALTACLLRAVRRAPDAAAFTTTRPRWKAAAVVGAPIAAV